MALLYQTLLIAQLDQLPIDRPETNLPLIY